MRRRKFLIGLATAVIGWPFAACPAAKRPRIAVLTLLSREDEGGRVAAFVGGLRELGYVPGQNIDVDYRFADGDTGRLLPLARELVGLAPNIVYAGEPSAARAAKNAAPDVPIVCPVLTDRLPDLFASYAHPGGNITGIASIVDDMNGKVVELALEVIPGLVRLGLLLNPHGASQAFVRDQVESAMRSRGLATLVEEAGRPDDIAPALARLEKAGVQAVIVPPNAMFINQRKSIVQLALAAKLPTFFEQRHDVEAGGFMSYGVNETEGSRRVALLVDKILKGARPGDLPIEFPTQIELVINLKTADALGLTVSRELQLRADQVIE